MAVHLFIKIINGAIGGCVSCTGFAIGDEACDHLLVLGIIFKFWHFLDLRDARKTLGFRSTRLLDGVVSHDERLDHGDIEGESRGEDAGSGKCLH